MRRTILLVTAAAAVAAMMASMSLAVTQAISRLLRGRYWFAPATQAKARPAEQGSSLTLTSLFSAQSKEPNSERADYMLCTATRRSGHEVFRLQKHRGPMRTSALGYTVGKTVGLSWNTRRNVASQPLSLRWNTLSNL